MDIAARKGLLSRGSMVVVMVVVPHFGTISVRARREARGEPASLDTLVCMISARKWSVLYAAISVAYWNTTSNVVNANKSVHSTPSIVAMVLPSIGAVPGVCYVGLMPGQPPPRKLASSRRQNLFVNQNTICRAHGAAGDSHVRCRFCRCRPHEALYAA